MMSFAHAAEQGQLGCGSGKTLQMLVPQVEDIADAFGSTGVEQEWMPVRRESIWIDSRRARARIWTEKVFELSNIK